MKQYHDLLNKVIYQGKLRDDRSGTGVLGMFGTQTRYNLAKSFPLVTTKRVYFKAIVHELLWFLMGDTNIQYLHNNDVHIWDSWADGAGDLGPIYGDQWRSWGGGIDQIAQVVHSIQTDPTSRRHIVSAWNPSDLDDMALPPCHLLFQFYVQDDRLSCQLYQRSADLFLGVPFNIASYSLLTHMIAHVTGLKVGEFIHTIGDAHIYVNHHRQVMRQLGRVHKMAPQIKIHGTQDSIFDIVADDIELIGYDPHPGIKAPVAV